MLGWQVQVHNGAGESIEWSVAEQLNLKIVGQSTHVLPSAPEEPGADQSALHEVPPRRQIAVCDHDRFGPDTQDSIAIYRRRWIAVQKQVSNAHSRGTLPSLNRPRQGVCRAQKRLDEQRRGALIEVGRRADLLDPSVA
jgi:hypothetical protein